MIFDCPSCAAALRFNPELRKLECLSCGNTYEVNSFTNNSTTPTGEELMECNIYSCTACGAELAINGVEASTFCAYCGQPTIVFNRVSLERKPKFIIPFSVTKEQAITKIRTHFKKGFFVPKAIKNFEVEKIRGIYIPYWIFDIHYRDSQLYVHTDSDGPDHYYFRQAECDFCGLALDASKILDNETTQRLEPYDLSKTKFFDPRYMSGFYSDCYDERKEELINLAFYRSSELFNKEVKKTIKESDVKLFDSNPKRNITRTEYALFPAWFLTFRHDEKVYTIAVNGQTGKVVGGVPFNKTKYRIPLVLLSIVFSVLSTVIIYPMLHALIDDAESYAKLIIGLCVVFAFIFLEALNFHDRAKKSMHLSRLSTTEHYVKDRQEGN